MRRAVEGLVIGCGLLIAGPGHAATIILLPAPGSMNAPRVLDDGGKSHSVYVCTSPSELSSGRCTLQKGARAKR